eukprot:7825190-Pyramimonas_sp.AAC.1
MTNPSSGSKSYVEADVEDAPPPPRQVSVDVDSYFSDPPDDAFELPEAEAETFLSALEEQELPEEELMIVLAAVIEEKLGKDKRRSWAEARKMKANKKIERDFFDKKRAARPGYKRIASGDLKRRSRCANCGEKGHWAESCRKPFRSKQGRLAAE